MSDTKSNAPQLSYEDAKTKGAEVLGWIIKAYLVGSPTRDVEEYIGLCLQQSYTDGALAGAEHLAEELKKG